MSRFNVLLVGTQSAMRAEVLKTLSKVFRSNFVFEASEMSEAESLLRKLHVDMVLVDLDQLRADFLALSKVFPQPVLVGVSSNPRAVDIPMNVYQHRMLNRRDLQASLLAEFKSLRKGGHVTEEGSRKAKLPSPAGSSDFLDFTPLVAKQA